MHIAQAKRNEGIPPNGANTSHRAADTRQVSAECNESKYNKPFSGMRAESIRVHEIPHCGRIPFLKSILRLALRAETREKLLTVTGKKYGFTCPLTPILRAWGPGRCEKSTQGRSAFAMTINWSWTGGLWVNLKVDRVPGVKRVSS